MLDPLQKYGYYIPRLGRASVEKLDSVMQSTVQMEHHRRLYHCQITNMTMMRHPRRRGFTPS
jgi:hypothetical protein